MSLIDAALGILCAAGGVALLHRAWRRRGGAGLVLRGWLILLLGVAPWRASGAAWDKAVALAMLTPSLLALVLVLWNTDWPTGVRKAPRVKEAAAVDLPPAAPIWRGVIRTLLAGPLAGAAALGLSALLALHGPGTPATRLVGAGLLFPLAWAGLTVWATTDAHLSRITFGLGWLTAMAFGAALL